MATRHRTLCTLLTVAILILTSGCVAPATLTPLPPLPTSLPDTPVPTAVPPTASAPGTLSGRVEYQAPPSPASVLYAVNVSDPQKWSKLDLPAADGPLAFSMQLPAGTYQLIARTQKGGAAAALLVADRTLGTVTVAAGQTTADILLQMVAPQVPCQTLRVPASPDGRFPAIEPVSPCLALTEEATATVGAPGTLSGRVEYQAPPSPASVVYAVDVADEKKWSKVELPAATGPLTFSLQVPAGAYQLIARTQKGAMAAALLAADKTIGSVTVETGQTVADIVLKLVAPQVPCQRMRVPASPDGLFPAIEPVANCTALTKSAPPTKAVPPTPAVPAPPRSFAFEYTCANNVATTTFTWTDSSDNEDGFRLYRNGTAVANIPANTTTYVDNAPIGTGETLQFRLVAYNGNGESGARTASVACQ